MHHVRSNDDLVLAAGEHGAHDALGVFESVLIELPAVLQLKAKTGGAVYDGRNVFFVAYRINDLPGQLFVIHRYNPFFFSWFSPEDRKDGN